MPLSANGEADVLPIGVGTRRTIFLRVAGVLERIVQQVQDRRDHRVGVGNEAMGRVGGDL